MFKKARRLEDSNMVKYIGKDKEGYPTYAIFDWNITYQGNFFTKREIFTFIVNEIKNIGKSEYSIVYFNDGNKYFSNLHLSLWYKIHSTLDYQTRKNIKNLYIVHPSGSLKFLIRSASFLSNKFLYKVNYIESLSQIKNFMNIEKISYPPHVVDHDINIGRTKASISGTRFYQEIPKSELFGVDLTKLCKVIGGSKAPDSSHDRVMLPRFLETLIDNICKDGVNLEGILRVSSTVNEKDIAVSRLSTNFDSSCFDPYVASDILKQFLRSLPEPLLGSKALEFIKSIQRVNEKEKFYKTAEYLRKLPAPNILLLRSILRMCDLIEKNKTVTLMSFANIAVVLAPNLVWGTKDPNQMLHDASYSGPFIVYLLNNYKALLK